MRSLKQLIEAACTNIPPSPEKRSTRKWRKAFGYDRLSFCLAFRLRVFLVASLFLFIQKAENQRRVDCRIDYVANGEHDRTRGIWSK